jgi:glycosyltransferase involved in cell wall biosynthesis
LAAAIGSVLAQTDRNLELIVVDDGSTDTTAEVVRRFGDDRMLYLNQPNRGVSAARNAGAGRARGEWLVFLDNDDELVPEALERFAAVGESDLIVAGVTRVSENGSERRTVLPDRVVVLEKRFSPLLAGAFAIRRSLFAAVGGYDEALAYSENTELAWRVRSHLDRPGAIEAIEEPVVIVHNRARRAHERSRYDAAKRILALRSYEMEADGNPRAAREFRGNYLCIAAVSAAELGKRAEAAALVTRAVASEPLELARYRSAVGVFRRLLKGTM